MDYSVKPDYKQCVSIVTQSALKQMIKPVRDYSTIRCRLLLLGYPFSQRPPASDVIRRSQRIRHTRGNARMSFGATA